MSLVKVELDYDRNDHFVYLDKTQIRAVQVQYPLQSSSGVLSIKGERETGVIRVFLKDMNHPFQFTRESVADVDLLLTQLVE